VPDPIKMASAHARNSPITNRSAWLLPLNFDPDEGPTTATPSSELTKLE
jgi:hypothetical protein